MYTNMHIIWSRSVDSKMNNFPTLEMALRNDSSGADAHLCFEDMKYQRCILVPPVLAFSPESISRFLVWAYSAFHVCACVMYRWKVISCVISFSCDSMLRELDAFWVSLSISACYDRAAAREWVPFWIKSDCDRSAAGSQFLHVSTN